MTIKSKLAAIVAVLLLSAAFAFAVFGQHSGGARGEKESGKDSAPNSQWGYLIVSGGNVNFSTAGNDSSMRKQTDAFSSEAYPLERNLDKLGQKGWELVAVQGSPQNPVFYLKRPKESR